MTNLEKTTIETIVELLNKSTELAEHQACDCGIVDMTSYEYLNPEDDYETEECYEAGYLSKDEAKSRLSDLYCEILGMVENKAGDLNYVARGCTSSLYLSFKEDTDEEFEIRISDHTDRHLERACGERFQIRLLPTRWFEQVNN